MNTGTLFYPNPLLKSSLNRFFMSVKLRRYLVKTLSALGGINYRWKKLPAGIYAFNYHRIGNAQEAIFDRAIFSCSSTAFEKHLQEIKANFTVINTVQLTELLAKGKAFEQRYALITFDDGYIDNYTHALPLLKKYQLPAVFYLVTDFINSKQIPWWDEIAYLLRHSSGQSYQLFRSEQYYFLDPKHIDLIIQKIMADIKRSSRYSIAQFLDDIRAKFPQAKEKLSQEKQALFMSWQQAKALQLSGMEIGSHTISHKILSQLSAKEQANEIIASKQILEAQLNCQLNSIAYPVGRYYCYNQTSLNYAKEAGYKIAFNNEAGYHQQISDCFNLNRYCVTHDNFNYLKFDCCFT